MTAHVGQGFGEHAVGQVDLLRAQLPPRSVVEVGLDRRSTGHAESGQQIAHRLDGHRGGTIGELVLVTE